MKPQAEQDTRKKEEVMRRMARFTLCAFAALAATLNAVAAEKVDRTVLPILESIRKLIDECLCLVNSMIIRRKWLMKLRNNWRIIRMEVF